MAVDRMPRRFTADEYERMEAVGSRHFRGVNQLNMLPVPALAGRGAIVSVQNPVELADYWMPRAGRRRAPRASGRLRRRQAAPDHVPLLIEVADSSPRSDRARLPAYARFGIAEVWLVDLNDDVILAHHEPLDDRYGLLRACRRGETIRPQFRPELVLDVEAILP